MRHLSSRHTAAFAQLVLAGFFLLAVPLPSLAVRESESDFSIVISEVRSLTLDAESIYLDPAASELIAGWTEERSWNATVCANVDWVLSIRGTDPTWEGPWPKPVGDIYWSYDGSEFVPLDTLPVEVCVDGPVDHKSYPITFRIALDPLEDVPGEYRYGYIVLELTAP